MVATETSKAKTLQICAPPNNIISSCFSALPITDTGLQAYFESGRAAGNRISKKDVQVLLNENARKPVAAPVSSDVISKVKPAYKADGNIVPQTRKTPKGLPEKIYPAGALKREEQNIFDFDGKNKDSVSVVDLTGLGKEKLELEYGYSGDEAEEALRYLRGITVPAEKDNFFRQSYAPAFVELLKGTNKAEVLRERVRERFGRTGGAPINFSTHGWNVSSSGTSEAVPLEFAPVRSVIDNADIGNEMTSFAASGGGISSSVFPSVSSDISRNGAVSFEQRDVQEDAVDIASADDTEYTESAVNFPVGQARDAELERHRKTEENYEKDKAVIAREKQPALARSESHDVGHAEGTGEDTGNSNQFINIFSDKVFYNLKRNAGL